MLYRHEIIRLFVRCVRRGSAKRACARDKLSFVHDKSASAPHLTSVDPQAWPGVATYPQGALVAMKARRAEARFAKACSQAGISFDSDGEPSLIVDHEQLFARVAAGGWIGLAESYMAGEWRTESPDELVAVLRALIDASYNPRTPSAYSAQRYSGGEVPPELVARFSGDGMSAFSGHFATGVPTTERVSVKSHSPGAGRGQEPANHFVSVTHFGEPLETAKLDLGDAQQRSVTMLLDAAGVQHGSHVAVAPNSGGAVEIAAGLRGATVDTVVADHAAGANLRERLTLAGVSDAVHIAERQQPLVQRSTSTLYDAIISTEHLETLPRALRVRYLRTIDAALARGGRAAVQTVVAKQSMSAAAEAALESLRAYIWPTLTFDSAEQMGVLADKETNLRVIAQTHAPEHLALSLKHQRTIFQSQTREAAADGFDAVYRRLWLWQLSLREALAQLGMIDAVQFTLAHRHRRGVR